MERAKRYRELSERAAKAAQSMPTLELQAGYLKLAHDWDALALEAEEAAVRTPPPVPIKPKA